LFIRLSDGAEVAWAAYDATGQLMSPVSRGPLSAARAAAEGRRCIVLAPAVDVITTQAELPAASPSRLRQILPFSLEDMFADDVDDLAFSVGARLDSGAMAVAVAARECIGRWLEALQAAGIQPTALCSEAEGVPDIPATLVLLIEGTRIFGRYPGHAPFVVEGITLRQALDLVRGADSDAAAPQHVLVYVDGPARAHFNTELANLADEFTSAEVKIAVDGLFPRLGSTLAQRPGTSLLQGTYAPKSNWAALAAPWRVAASLLVVAAALALVSQGAEYWSLRRTDGALAELLTANCQRIVGDARPSACQREVQQRLGSNATSGSANFLATLAAIAASRDPATRIDALGYRNQTMNLQLIATSLPALDDFARSLEQTQRFDAEIESTNQSDGGIE
jgi:general secretion pathway protein L